MDVDEQESEDILAALHAHRINPALLEFGGGKEYEGGQGAVRKATLYQLENTPPETAGTICIQDGKVILKTGSRMWDFMASLSATSHLTVKTKTTVAVKCLKFFTAVPAASLKRRFVREMLVWSGLQHKNVSPFLGFYVDFQRNVAWLVSPWQANGNVREYIQANGLDTKNRIRLIRDTACGLAYLHRLVPPISHGDIKSANVLVTDDGRARLCDFGLSSILGDARLQTTSNFKGSLRWCSPELFFAQRRTLSSDVWAWGMLTFEIITGKIPFQAIVVESVVIRRIIDGKTPSFINMEQSLTMEKLVKLVRQCWAMKPSNRPMMSECHSLLQMLSYETSPSGGARLQFTSQDTASNRPYSSYYQQVRLATEHQEAQL